MLCLFVALDDQRCIDQIRFSIGAKTDDEESDAAVLSDQPQVFDLMRMDALEGKARLVDGLLGFKIDGASPIDAVVVLGTL